MAHEHAKASSAIVIQTSSDLSKFQVARCKTRTWKWLHRS